MVISDCNKNCMGIRKEKRNEILDKEIETKIDEKQIAMGDNQEMTSHIIKKEENRILFDAIEHLEQKQKTVIILYYYNEFSISEIAKITGSLEGTVKSRLFTARRNLKNGLNQNEYNLKGGLEYGKI